MRATIYQIVFLDTMSDYPTPAVGTGRSQGMNRTFKAIKDVFFLRRPANLRR